MERAESSLPGSRRAYWACQLGGWGLLATLTHEEMRADGLSQSRALLEPAVIMLAGVGLTHLYRALARARHWHSQGVLAAIPRTLASAVVMATGLVLALAPIELWLYHDDQPSPLHMILRAILRWTLIFTIWCGLYADIRLRRQRQHDAARGLLLDKALQAAELRALKSQLNPHFLFNSLNSVRALIADDPTRAQEAVTQLARMLRYSLGAANEELVPLERELAIVEDYLALEALRLGDRLIVARQVSDEARRAQIPVMLLETLIENAIKHGIAQLPAGGTLALRAALDDNELTIEVDNPRPATASPLAGGPGVGIANASERLRLLFGAAARLELDLSRPERATARVRIRQRA